MKRTIALLLACLTLFTLASCNLLQELKPYEAEDKIFEKAGLTITLTEAFNEGSAEGYTACYESLFATVFVLKEPFDSFEGFEDYTIKDYERLILEANASKNPVSSELEGMPVMEYAFYNEDVDVDYRYYAVMLKGADAFFMVQFACAEEYYEEFKPHFEEWAKSVEA